MWFLNAFLRLMPPLAVRVKRFAAPRLVLIFGILISQYYLAVCQSDRSFSRRHDHHHKTAFALGLLLYDAQFVEISTHPI